MRTAAVIASLALVTIACSRTKLGSTPAPGPVAVAPTATPGEGGLPGAPGVPAGSPRRRVPPNPMQQDTLRRAIIDSLLGTIKGRENEPAGTVFKNVKLLKAMPAAEFLRTMNEQYGRGLGWTCSNCHVAGRFDDDTKKNKRLARQMQAMTDYINGPQLGLGSMKELDAEFDRATCVMCHRGNNEPKGTMAVPMPILPPTPGPAD